MSKVEGQVSAAVEAVVTSRRTIRDLQDHASQELAQYLPVPRKHKSGDRATTDKGSSLRQGNGSNLWDCGDDNKPHLVSVASIRECSV